MHHFLFTGGQILPPFLGEAMRYFMSALIAMATLYCTPVFGQSSVFLRGGVNLAGLAGNAPERQGFHQNMKIGLSVVVPLRERVGLQIGAGYVSKGAKTHVNGDNGIHIDYIELSGLGNIEVKSSTPSLFLLIGPTMAFKVNSKGGDYLLGSWQEEKKFEFKALDFGIAGGMGTQLLSPFRVVFLYTMGIRSVNKTDFLILLGTAENTVTEQEGRMINHTMSLSIGLGLL